VYFEGISNKTEKGAFFYPSLILVKVSHLVKFLEITGEIVFQQKIYKTLLVVFSQSILSFIHSWFHIMVGVFSPQLGERVNFVVFHARNPFCY
jgi:hypothetical protein